MKQFFTLLALAVSLLAKSAPEQPIGPEAIKAFETTYGKNTTAAWTCTPAGCEVAFELKGQYITALYTHGGQLRWYKKHILSTQLPVALQIGLKKRTNGFWISDVVEQSGKTGTVYTLTLENAAKKMILKAVGGAWQITKTDSKA